MNVADAEPPGMVTLGGTVAAARSRERVTTAPAVGATPVSVTVPAALVPPVTLAGLILKDLNVAALTVNEAVFVTPFCAAEIVTAVSAATPLLVTVKVAVVKPAGTVTVAGTVAAPVLLLERLTR